MSFFPLDKGVVKSSLYLLGTPTEWKVWTHLMLTADPRTGSVDQEAWVIGRDTNIPEEDVEACLRTFESPDPRSRTKDDDGRKIRREGSKIFLINYMRFREKDHSTPRVKAWRERRKRSETDGNGTKRRSTVTETKDKDKYKDTDKAVSSTVVPLLPAAPPRAPKVSWSKDACDLWIARFEGVAPGGAIGRHLKPLVDKYGAETVMASWKSYLEASEAEFASPAAFAQKFGEWRREAPKPVPAPEKLPEADATAFHFFEGMKIRLAGVLPLNSHATWFRPVFGRAWEDDGKTLVLVVPSQQFADQMKLYRERMRGAATEMGREEVRFRCIVVKDAVELHDGSVR